MTSIDKIYMSQPPHPNHVGSVMTLGRVMYKSTKLYIYSCRKIHPV